jgi:curli biogenesis system outer membrane secretion channel CsgG
MKQSILGALAALAFAASFHASVAAAEGERLAVTMYEFRSSVSAVSAAAATDMFKTALVKTGKFRVVERARLNEGAVREKQLNAGGLTTGDASRHQLRGAQVVFEGTISEAAASTKQRSSGVNVGGLDIGSGSNTDQLGIDVRVVDVKTGDVLDAINVRVPIKSSSSAVSGVGNLLGTVLARKGKDTTYVPDVRHQDSQRESVDAALRDAIEQAVDELAKRRDSWK